MKLDHSYECMISSSDNHRIGSVMAIYIKLRLLMWFVYSLVCLVFFNGWCFLFRQFNMHALASNHREPCRLFLAFKPITTLFEGFSNCSLCIARDTSALCGIRRCFMHCLILQCLSIVKKIHSQSNFFSIGLLQKSDRK